MIHSKQVTDSLDPSNPEALTPVHFIFGSALLLTGVSGLLTFADWKKAVRLTDPSRTKSNIKRLNNIGKKIT